VNQPMKPPRRWVRDPLARLMRKRAWGWKTPRNGIRSRLYSLTIEHHPWWDWGHRLMILTGTDMAGNWSEPEPPTWWYRRGQAKPMWRTGFPRHPMRSFEIVTDYEEFRRRTEGLNEDGMYEWQAIAVNEDGQLILGHQYWGGNFYGLAGDEVALLRRYLRMWRRLDWFGARSWLYSLGLHAAVHRKVPRSCQAQAPKGQGGYDHWYCQLPRRHDGMHRYNNYVWGDIGGEPIGAIYNPTERNQVR
jgi:hypothetical protein